MCIAAKKSIRIFLITLFSFLTASLLCSCKGLELENKTEQVEEYTKAQAMIIIANERNRYKNAYTDKIWDIVVGDDGAGFDRLMIQNVKQYLERLKLLCMLSEERGIAVNSAERDQIRMMTDEYMQQLTDADIAYIGCDRSDIQKMYTDLFTADKLMKSITSAVNSELSDSEV